MKNKLHDATIQQIAKSHGLHAAQCLPSGMYALSDNAVAPYIVDSWIHRCAGCYRVPYNRNPRLLGNRVINPSELCG